MSWNIGSIAKERREKADELYKNANRDDLLTRIVQLETALYPFAYVFGALDDRPTKGMMATSDLFAMTNGHGQMLQYRDGNSHPIEQPAADQLHSTEYYKHESLNICSGDPAFNDGLSVFAVHQYEGAAYCSCGDITMADVRRIKALIWPTPARAGHGEDGR